MDLFLWLGPFLACLRMLFVGVIFGALLSGPYVMGVGDASFFAAELAFCWLSVANLRTAQVVDRSLWGLLIPILYFVSGLLGPFGGVTSNAQQIFLFVVSMPRWVSIVCLGSSCTAGVPTFVRLRRDGLYRFLRHPLDSSGILARVGFLIIYPCWWNVFCVALGVAVTVGVVIVEERFLMEREEWVAYASRVRWRLMPGLW